MPFKILVADDDPVVRHILCSVLRASGCEVIETLSGQSCLAALKNAEEETNLPGLIFLDLQLGDMSGSEVISRWQGSKKSEFPPVILLSGHSESDTKQLFPELAGLSFVKRYIQKPFPPAQIRELLAEFA